MQAKEYEASIARFWFKDDGTTIPLSIAALGLAGETGELLEELDKEYFEFDTEKTVKELGDVYWYTAAILHGIGLSLTDLPDIHATRQDGVATRVHKDDLPVHVGRVCDMIKKQEWHGKAFNKDAMLLELACVVDALTKVANTVRRTMEQVRQANVDKLSARYPQGFREGGGIRA